MVDKFLCCMELETGGFVIGWLGIIYSIIISIFTVLAMMALIPTEWGFLAFLILIPLVIFIGMGVIYYLLIMGTKQRNHNRVLPAMMADIIGCFLSIGICLRADTPEGMLNGFISIIISIYFVIVLYSLYVKFRDEKERPQPVQTVLVTQYIPVQAVPNQQQVYMFPIDQKQQLQQQQFGQPQQYVFQQQIPMAQQYAQQIYNPPPQYVPQEPEKMKQ